MNSTSAVLASIHAVSPLLNASTDLPPVRHRTVGAAGAGIIGAGCFRGDGTMFSGGEPDSSSGYIQVSHPGRGGPWAQRDTKCGRFLPLPPGGARVGMHP